MGTLVLAGATSGSTTLTPVDAVTTVLTLPSATATLATLGANTFTGNQSITGTLGVTGASTVAAVTGSGVHTLNGAPTLGNAQLSINSNSGANTSYAGIVLVNSASSGGYLTLADASNTGWYGAHAGDLTLGGALGVGIKLRVNANDNLGLSISTAGAVTIPGTLGVTGTITPGQTTGIVGTTTNNNAQAGSVGEYVESVVANVSFTTSGGAGNNITSISLTAGDWDVSLTCIIETNGATITTSQITTSKYSGADNTDRVYGSNWIYTYLTGGIAGTISPYRVSVSSSQTVYAKWAGTYTAGTPYMNCRLSARRVR